MESDEDMLSDLTECYDDDFSDDYNGVLESCFDGDNSILPSKKPYIVFKKADFRRGYDNAKECPAPRCKYAVEFEPGSTSSTGYVVVCDCSHAFCWNCSEDAHRPVDCDTVAKWFTKNRLEAEKTTESKGCHNFFKNLGFKSDGYIMTFFSALFRVLCYSLNGVCNYLLALKRKLWDPEDDRVKDMAKKSLERYAFHHERWVSNQKLRQKAIQDLHILQTDHMKQLSKKLGEPESQLKFIVEAWKQIAECRRVLTWTYVYGYYLPEHEEAKKQLFEYQQGEAEVALERLHHCAVEELSAKFLNHDVSLIEDFSKIKETIEDFSAFRSKLVGLTQVTRLFFENLVRALENGLSEVQSPQEPQKAN